MTFYMSTLQLLLIVHITISVSSAFLSRMRNEITRDRVLSAEVWIEQAEDGFVDDDENLMTGEVCLRSMKAFADDPFDKGEKRFLGAAALVSRPSSHICDCWIADTLLDGTNIQVQGAQLLLDDLFYHHLQRSNANTVEGMISSFIVQSGSAGSDYHCASYMAALDRGFRPLKDIINDEAHEHRYLDNLNLKEEDPDILVFDILSGIERYSMTRSSALATRILEILQRDMSRPMVDRYFE